MLNFKKIPNDMVEERFEFQCPICNGKLWKIYEYVNRNWDSWYITDKCESCGIEIRINDNYLIHALQGGIVSQLDENVSSHHKAFLYNFLNFLDLFD